MRLWHAVGALLIALPAAGCSLRDDPSYNRFAPRDDQPHVTQRADHVMNAGQRALDNARQHAENIID
jgi:hypothetical protein